MRDEDEEREGMVACNKVNHEVNVIVKWEYVAGGSVPCCIVVRLPRSGCLDTLVDRGGSATSTCPSQRYSWRALQKCL